MLKFKASTTTIALFMVPTAARCNVPHTCLLNITATVSDRSKQLQLLLERVAVVGTT